MELPFSSLQTPCYVVDEALLERNLVILKQVIDLSLIHISHADLRDDYLGARLSHATVLRRVWDLVGDGRIFQFGIRSGDREEFLWGREHVFTRRRCV